MSFKSKNLSYMFHKEYYAEVTTESGVARSEKEISTANHAFVSTGVPLECRQLGSHSFALQVQYPGLLIGLGNAHQSTAIDGDIRGDIALGFSFDYVTGTPYIPGSTVKGVIRNAFSQGNGAYVQAFVGDTVNIAMLEKEIFGTSAEEDEDFGKDVFFDAFPSASTPKTNPGALFHLLDIDVITPHGEGLNTTPNPLSFVKVKPGVVFDFRFNLYDGIITAGKKRALFKQILKDFGIGAKTNVGFGILDEVNPDLAISGSTQSPRAGTPECTKKVCPHCGATNMKHKKNSNEINISWQRNRCFKCKEKLS